MFPQNNQLVPCSFSSFLNLLKAGFEYYYKRKIKRQILKILASKSALEPTNTIPELDPEDLVVRIISVLDINDKTTTQNQSFLFVLRRSRNNSKDLKFDEKRDIKSEENQKSEESETSETSDAGCLSAACTYPGSTTEPKYMKAVRDAVEDYIQQSVRLRVLNGNNSSSVVPSSSSLSTSASASSSSFASSSSLSSSL